MTWHTPRGDRVLAGPEAELFHNALMTNNWGDPKLTYCSFTRLCNQFFNHVAVEVRQAEITAGVTICKLFVVITD